MDQLHYQLKVVHSHQQSSKFTPPPSMKLRGFMLADQDAAGCGENVDEVRLNPPLFPHRWSCLMLFLLPTASNFNLKV